MNLSDLKNNDIFIIINLPKQLHFLKENTPYKFKEKVPNHHCECNQCHIYRFVAVEPIQILPHATLKYGAETPVDLQVTIIKPQKLADILNNLNIKHSL